MVKREFGGSNRGQRDTKHFGGDDAGRQRGVLAGPETRTLSLTDHHDDLGCSVLVLSVHYVAQSVQSVIRTEYCRCN